MATSNDVNAYCNSCLLRNESQKKRRPSSCKRRHRGSTMLVYFRKIVDTSDENLPLKIFLIFVSLVIVASVSAVWYIYHQHQLQVFIGRGIRIIERPRLLYLADKRGVDKLEGRIGEHIPNHLLPYDCQHQADGANICLDWKYRARLRVFINYTSSSGPHKDVQCFKIEWKGVAGERLKDCFSLGQAAWYGIGESLPQLWPIDKWKKSSSPFVTGSSYRDAFGSVLERYLLTSEGVSISVDDDVPLYVSINEDDRSEICLESRYSDRYPYRNLGESDGPFLRYVLCAGSDVKTTHSYVMKTRWSEKVFDSEAVLDKYFEVPSWSTEPKLADGLNESSLLSFANSITRSGYKTGILTIGGRWEENVGDSTFDQENFPSSRRTIIVLRNKGFLPLLTFAPYVSIKSPTFDSGSRNGLFIHDSAPTNKKKIPLLTYWKGCVVATMDLTNSATRRWIGDALRNITDTYEVVGFSFVGGESLYLPENYRSDVSTVNPDRITYDYENFTSHVDPTYYVSITSSTLQSRNNGSAHHNTKVSTFTPRRSDWSYDGGLKSVIPNVLTMGVLGNTIINIGSVGGDIIVATDDDDDDTKPDKELYIRWLQLATFMPIMQFSVAPFDYDDDERVVEISRKLLAIRNELLVPYFKKHLRLSIEQGSPIIRPLWWIDPSDSQTYRIDSQFLIYDKIVVAPVLEKGADTRNIYLPDGWWRDELRGSITKGKKWIYDYRAPLDQIPYFVSLEGAPID